MSLISPNYEGGPLRALLAYAFMVMAIIGAQEDDATTLKGLPNDAVLFSERYLRFRHLTEKIFMDGANSDQNLFEDVKEIVKSLKEKGELVTVRMEIDGNDGGDGNVHNHQSKAEYLLKAISEINGIIATKMFLKNLENGVVEVTAHHSAISRALVLYPVLLKGSAAD